MPDDTDDRPRTVVVEQLTALGLSTYAARTFVALARLGEGTAADVSDVAEVPRTRVYDAVDELRDRGLVDVQQSTPRRFRAVSAETAGRNFDREYTRRVNRLIEAVDGLDATPRTTEQRGVWTVTGREAVTDRVLEFVESADEEVVYMTVGDLLTSEITDVLRAASDHGVSIRVGGMARSTETTIRDELLGAQTFESL